MILWALHLGTALEEADHQACDLLPGAVHDTQRNTNSQKKTTIGGHAHGEDGVVATEGRICK
jgi:hypothetical protein